MKPKPFCELKNFTVPVAISISLINAPMRPRPAQPFAQVAIRIWRVLEGPKRAGRPGRQNRERPLDRQFSFVLQSLVGRFGQRSIARRLAEGNRLEGK